MTRIIKRLFFGRKFSQSFFKRMFSLSLEGMNIGTGGGGLQHTGEDFFIKNAFKYRGKPIVFDVGAQGGDYLSEILKITRGNADLHAFEPNSRDYMILQKDFGSSVTVVNSALGEKNGEATLYFPEGVSGLSSLHGGDARFTKSEKVKIETIDSYCQRLNIRQIDLLKLDVEGHELSCLRGAQKMLPFITTIQFEIGIASRDSRVYFKDIFELLSDYKISRILKDGLEEVKNPDKTSELLFTTNFVAERK